MTKLSTNVKIQLLAIAEKHCKNYLELYQILTASYSELSNDDYLVGTGLDVEAGSAEERLEKQFTLATHQLHDFLRPITSLEPSEKDTLYSLTESYMCNFSTYPNQEEFAKLNNQLPLFLDILSPPKKLVPIPPVTSREIVASPLQVLTTFNTNTEKKPPQHSLLHDQIQNMEQSQHSLQTVP